MNVFRVSILALAGLLAGCASIVEGTDQTLTFKIEPESANCSVMQKGKMIGTINGGGGQLNVPKSKEDLSVECAAPGYKKQIVNLASSASGWGIVGCFLIDLCITDYSTGALNKYDEVVSIRLPPAQGVAAAPSPPQLGVPSGFQAPASPPTLTDKWRTKHNQVRGYWGSSTQNQYVIMPTHVPLELVRSEGKWGLYRYVGADSSVGQVWILLTETELIS